MDKTVPKAAGFLLDYISIPEARGDYNTYNAFKQHLLPKPLTKMTIKEVLQINWQKIGANSSAAGRYQIIKGTLQGLITELKISVNALFDANMQDRLAYHLLRRRGYDAWATGRIDHIEFGKRLAMEWASLPVLAGTKNNKGQNIKRGSSYYAGDGLNSHGVTADDFHNTLEIAFKRYELFTDTKPTKNGGTTTKVATGVVVGAGTAVVATDPSTAPDVDTMIKVGNYLQSALTGGNVVFAAVVVIGVAGLAYLWWKRRNG